MVTDSSTFIYLPIHDAYLDIQGAPSQLFVGNVIYALQQANSDYYKDSDTVRYMYMSSAAEVGDIVMYNLKLEENGFPEYILVRPSYTNNNPVIPSRSINNVYVSSDYIALGVCVITAMHTPDNIPHFISLYNVNSSLPKINEALLRLMESPYHLSNDIVFHSKIACYNTANITFASQLEISTNLQGPMEFMYLTEFPRLEVSNSIIQILGAINKDLGGTLLPYQLQSKLLTFLYTNTAEVSTSILLDGQYDIQRVSRWPYTGTRLTNFMHEQDSYTDDYITHDINGDIRTQDVINLMKRFALTAHIVDIEGLRPFMLDLSNIDTYAAAYYYENPYNKAIKYYLPTIGEWLYYAARCITIQLSLVALQSYNQAESITKGVYASSSISRLPGNTHSYWFPWYINTALGTISCPAINRSDMAQSLVRPFFKLRF